MQNVNKKLNIFIIAALTACLLITCMPINCHSTFSLIQNVNAASKDNVLWYNIDGNWAGFDPELKMLTWWPSESEGAVIVPDNFDGIPVMVIGEWAFYKHENITSVTLPETVEKLDEGAFSGCSALQSINGLDNVVSIGDYAFRNCSKLKDINSFKSLRSIGNKAFDGCSSLTDLVIPAASFDKPSITTNVSRNIYSDSVRADKEDWNYCSDKVGSYLYWDGQFYWRVECSGVVIVEKYTKDLEFVEGFNLETDLLKIWGGFYCGKKYNFIVTGSYNYEENDKTPVIRVDKYSKTWKKLKTLEIKNFNTVEFPRSTALRFAEYKNFLYIHSARRMYAADDGYNHQESVTLQINEKTMKLMNSTADKSRYFSGTVSHSFNQFILVDSEKNIITLDHGDASPRSIVLSKLNGKAGKGNPFSQRGTRLEIYKIPKYSGDEEWGYNMTGTSVGGLEETKTGYITAYATDGKGGNAEYDGIKNIYYTFTPKSDFSEKATVTKKITSYSGSGKTSAGTPQVVSTGTDGYIIWDIIEKGKVSGKIAYVKYDSKGKISKVKTMDGVLSDCKPIYVNGKVLWYVTDDSTPKFYSLTEVIQPNDNVKEPTKPDESKE